MKFVLTEKATGKPLANVPVEMSEARARVRVVTAADGTFTLPVEAGYLRENPVIVVAIPRGVEGYELALAPEPPPAAPPAKPADQAAPVEPAVPPASAPQPVEPAPGAPTVPVGPGTPSGSNG